MHCWDQAYFDFAVRGSFNVLDEACKHAARDAATRERIKAALHVGGGGGGAATTIANAPALRWRRISYELLPHPFKWHGHVPQQIPRAVVALGGVIAVHLWTTVSPVSPAEPITPCQRSTRRIQCSVHCHRSALHRARARVLQVSPAERIACARMMGFWSLPEDGGAPPTPGAPPGLRVGPLLAGWEKALPSEALFYREALVELLERLRESRMRSLRALGFPSTADHAARLIRLGGPRSLARSARSSPCAFTAQLLVQSVQHSVDHGDRWSGLDNMLQVCPAQASAASRRTRRCSPTAAARGPTAAASVGGTEHTRHALKLPDPSVPIVSRAHRSPLTRQSALCDCAGGRPPRPSARLNYSEPGGKCAAGMFTHWTVQPRRGGGSL